VADAIAVTASKGITVDAAGVAVNVDGSSIMYMTLQMEINMVVA
jgi:hypothetical protein